MHMCYIVLLIMTYHDNICIIYNYDSCMTYIMYYTVDIQYIVLTRMLSMLSMLFMLSMITLSRCFMFI